ncbi:MAG TPA: 23S rRNA (uracil(1939)-C(5))-methyltransferase RlmD [Candidatus Angelobacter sp.]|nr:23S rRNA (uracil(1939)-C(5))-methyltransferase RlmD [Candidatus Angelobacter sp.]
MNLTIEKMVYGGEGLARMPDGKAVFVPFVLPGEEVAATVAHERSSFARAVAGEVLKRSAHRVEAKCQYFANCGGCHYQHTSYESQLEIKRGILRETLQRNAKLEWKGQIKTHSGDPWNYRNRARMKVQGGADFAMGYHRMASNDLLPVKSCPISSPAINRAIERLWDLGEAGKVPGGVKEIEFFADHTDERLVLEIYHAPGAEGIREFAAEMQARVSAVRGIALFALPGRGSRLTQLTETLGNPILTYQVGDKSFRVSAGSFFQTNRHLVRELAQTVAGDFHGRIALDLYAGVGLFANHLAKRFEQVFAVETSPASAADLQANAHKNVVPVRTKTEQFLPRALNMNPEVVVLDPPRAGLGARASQLLSALRVKRIVYVACDPATLARDVRFFLDFGYKVEEVHLVDLFPQTFHLECVIRLVR